MVFFYICNKLYKVRYFVRSTIEFNIISSHHPALADDA